MPADKLRWKAMDRNRLLQALLNDSPTGGFVSFEGDLNKTKLMTVPNATSSETVALKRNTLWPKQDFVVIPLSTISTQSLSAAMGGTIPSTILHIPIERDGQSFFGAYENFNTC